MDFKPSIFSIKEFHILQDGDSSYLGKMLIASHIETGETWQLTSFYPEKFIASALYKTILSDASQDFAFVKGDNGEFFYASKVITESQKLCDFVENKAANIKVENLEKVFAAMICLLDSYSSDSNIVINNIEKLAHATKQENVFSLIAFGPYDLKSLYIHLHKYTLPDVYNQSRLANINLNLLASQIKSIVKTLDEKFPNSEAVLQFIDNLFSTPELKTQLERYQEQKNNILVIASREYKDMLLNLANQIEIISKIDDIARAVAWDNFVHTSNIELADPIFAALKSKGQNDYYGFDSKSPKFTTIEGLHPLNWAHKNGMDVRKLVEKFQKETEMLRKMMECYEHLKTDKNVATESQINAFKNLHFDGCFEDAKIADEATQWLQDNQTILVIQKISASETE